MLQGLVINSQKNFIFVKNENKIIQCRLRGKLLKEDNNNYGKVVVGDNVSFEKTDLNNGIIHDIFPRKNKFSRREAGPVPREQIIAANIDQAVIVCSVKNPGYKINGIERYISAANSENIEPIVCFNKMDLIDFGDIEDDIKQLQKNGIKTVSTSTLTGDGINNLKDLISDKISLFSGSSGVGKSSLINYLTGYFNIKTNQVSSFNDKGKHTTTSSYVYELPLGGMIIDSPGMKEFGLFEADKGVKKTFQDIEVFSSFCRYKNCSHTHEPLCGVKTALEEGKIDQNRYDNYIKLSGK